MKAGDIVRVRGQELDLILLQDTDGRRSVGCYDLATGTITSWGVLELSLARKVDSVGAVSIEALAERIVALEASLDSIKGASEVLEAKASRAEGHTAISRSFWPLPDISGLDAQAVVVTMSPAELKRLDEVRGGLSQSTAFRMMLRVATPSSVEEAHYHAEPSKPKSEDWKVGDEVDLRVRLRRRTPFNIWESVVVGYSGGNTVLLVEGELAAGRKVIR